MISPYFVYVYVLFCAGFFLDNGMARLFQRNEGDLPRGSGPTKGALATVAIMASVASIAIVLVIYLGVRTVLRRSCRLKESLDNVSLSSELSISSAAAPASAGNST